ncbi:hypothetical protein ES703_98161 [subsurface metagenome]
MACIRCGREEKIENHHIIARIKGGGDEPENKEKLCSACHDYEHAQRDILEGIQFWEDKLGRARKVSRRLAIRARLELLRHRLEVLDSLNSPEQIRLTGKYTTYWNDETTHEIIAIPKEAGNQNFEMADQAKLL